MKHFSARKLMTALFAIGCVGTNQAMASAFQIWEQDVIGVGNFHSGYAAELNTAASAWTNPAGMTRIKNQQVVFGTSYVRSHFQYKGEVGLTDTIGTEDTFQIITNANYPNVLANGGATNYVPNLEYVAPINDTVSFGFNVVVPFGLETDYGNSTPMKYAATRTAINVIDISPSLGFKVTDKASLGAGFDVQLALADFNAVAGTVQPGEDTVDPLTDTDIKNHVRSIGYGFHLGALYEFTPNTRVGISYHSQVRHHFSGRSRFIGPLAEVVTAEASDSIISRDAKANVSLPAYTALSAFHQINPSWAVMATAIYTQWQAFHTLTLHNAAGAIPVEFPEMLSRSTSIDVSIPEHYRNSWSLSVGANYIYSDALSFRGGIGYDETPIVDKYRNVQLPDQNRIGLGLGGHYQATQTVGVDLGWTHIMHAKAKLHPPVQVNGAVAIETSGNTDGGGDVVGAQITWDIV